MVDLCYQHEIRLSSHQFAKHAGIITNALLMGWCQRGIWEVLNRTILSDSNSKAL
jgi:hypothetical protein